MQAATDARTSAGHRAIGVPCDVADEAQVAALVERTVGEFGRLDMAFNNAGIMIPPSDAADEPAERFERDNAVNLRGVWNCMKHELRVMAQAFEDADGTRFPSLPHALAEQISGLEPVMAAEADARDYALDPGVLMRMMFGLVIAVSVHGDWLFGPDARPARERLLDQMTAFTNHGLRGR